MKNNIINELSKKIQYGEKSKAVQAREEQARKAVLERYGVDDTRTLTAEAESEVFRRDSIENAGLADLFNIASAIAFKKMRFKFNQGYDSFAVSNQSIHDELADTALYGMTEYITGNYCVPFKNRHDAELYGKDCPTFAEGVDMAMIAPVTLIRAGYAAMDSYINDTARDERRHLYTDVSECHDALNLQDVTACIESGYRDSELAELFETCISEMNPRQQQVFKYLLKGYTDETIAKRLGCSRPNVTKIRHTVRKRLQAVRDYLTEQE